MYLRGIHAESHIPSFRNFIKKNPLGTLTTAIASPNFPFLQVSHIPWVLDVTDDTSESELGVLRGHMVRQNPQAKALMESAKSTSSDRVQGGVQLQDQVLVLFTAKLQARYTDNSRAE